VRNNLLALEFDLACQYALNKHDMEIEKMRLSIWGEPKEAQSNGHKPKAQSRPQKQMMTAKDIMRNYHKHPPKKRFRRLCVGNQHGRVN